jgi:hypothetical protein
MSHRADLTLADADAARLGVKPDVVAYLTTDAWMLLTYSSLTSGAAYAEHKITAPRRSVECNFESYAALMARLVIKKSLREQRLAA